MDTSRPRFNSAHVIALIALFVALAGTSFAAVKLGKGSVKTKNLAAKAVTGPKIANNAVTGAKLANGAVTNDKVAVGTLGADRLTPAARDSLKEQPAVAPRGYSVKGAYDISFTATAGGQQEAYGISLGYAWSTAPQATYIQDGQPVPPECAGGTVTDPKASPGYICLFEAVGTNRNVSLGVPVLTGTFLGISSAAAGAVRGAGSWAATAP